MVESYQKVHNHMDTESMTLEDLNRRESQRRKVFTIALIVVVVGFGFFVAFVKRQRLPSPTEMGMMTFEDLNLKTQNTPIGCESTLMILRHCEKYGPEVSTDGGNQHCSFLGHERAHFLATLFGNGGWPVPSVLYALTTERTGHLNFRQVETLTPLADKYGLYIDASMDSNEAMVEAFYSKLANGEMCGKVAVVSWKHEYIGDLVKQLGCTRCPDGYPDNEFDIVWQIKYVYDVKDTQIYEHNIATAKAAEPSKRMLKATTTRASSRKVQETKHGWTTYFAKSNQGFDPLKFSAAAGDYNGNKIGGSWLDKSGGEM